MLSRVTIAALSCYIVSAQKGNKPPQGGEPDVQAILDWGKKNCNGDPAADFQKETFMSPKDVDAELLMPWLEQWGMNNCSEDALNQFGQEFGSMDNDMGKDMDDEMQWINDHCQGDMMADMATAMKDQGSKFDSEKWSENWVKENCEYDEDDMMKWFTENCTGDYKKDQQATQKKEGSKFDQDEFDMKWYEQNCPSMDDHNDMDYEHYDMDGHDHDNWNSTDEYDYDYDYEWDDDMSFNDTDWFGAMVNDTCPEDCNVEDCSVGVMCIVTTCQNNCTREISCAQDYLMTWSSDWETVDCMQGVQNVTQNCESYCEYEDCSSERGGQTCWIETCDDGCGVQNCSVWFQQDGQWYGEYCEDDGMGLDLDEFRPQDVLKGVQDTTKAYANTIDDVFKAFCPANDTECLNGGQEIQAAMNGSYANPQKMREENAPNTTAVSEMANNQVAGVFGMAQNATVNAIQNYTDMFFTPEFKGIIDSFQNDTSAFDPSASTAGLNAFDTANSTEEAFKNADSEFTVGNVVGVVDMFIPEDNKAINNFWGTFKQGLFNSGSERKGEREQN